MAKKQGESITPFHEIVNAQSFCLREYQTDVGPADYVLFVNKKPVGIIEAKREEEAVRRFTNIGK